MKIYFDFVGKCLLVCIIFCGTSQIFANETNSGLFPFSIKAIVSADIYRRPNQTNPSDSVQSSVSFSWSNGIWQIEQVSTSVPKFVTAARGTNVSPLRIMNCKRVPDGVRYYTLFTNATTQAADDTVPIVKVIPTPFPPINFREQLLSWLAFCPNPELPVVSSNKIQRFTSQLHLNDADNIGDYHVSYMDTNGFFLSELSISDSGVVKHLDGTTRRRDPPFADGFIDFRFRTLEVTNVNGVLFPKRAKLELLSPLPNAKTQDDSWPMLACSLEVEQVDCDEVNFKSPNLTFFVSDDRIPKKPGLLPLRYIETNDVFVSKTNKRLVALASIPEGKPLIKNKGAMSKLSLVRWILLTVAIAPLVIVICLKIKQQLKQLK